MPRIKTPRLTINHGVSLKHARDLYNHHGRATGMYRRERQEEQLCHHCAWKLCTTMQWTPRQISEIMLYTLVKSTVGARCDDCHRRVTVKTTATGRKRAAWGMAPDPREDRERERVDEERRRRGLPPIWWR